MKLLLDRVLVRRHTAKKETDAGLVIPDAFAKPPDTGEVVDVGTDEGKLLHVKPGETILFHPQAGMPIEYEGESLLIIRSADIVAVL